MPGYTPKNDEYFSGSSNTQTDVKKSSKKTNKKKKDYISDDSSVSEKECFIYTNNQENAKLITKNIGLESFNINVLKGDRGDCGPRGEKGDCGPRGKHGPCGKRGEKGHIGKRGHSGKPGSAVAKGDTGSTGHIGPTGLQGLQGLIGPFGQIGPTGNIGPTGIQGLIGPIGPNGQQGLSGGIIDYAYFYNNVLQTINSNSNINFNQPIINTSGITYLNGNILIVNQGVYKVSIYTFFQQNEQISISLNGTILSSAIFNDNYGQCILTISQDNTTMNLVNTTSTNLNLLLPTGNGSQPPINASIIIERFS